MTRAYGTPIEHTIHDLARQRVVTKLDGIWKSMGPLNREELAAMMDGAQEAVMEWMPPLSDRVEPPHHELGVQAIVREESGENRIE